MGIPVNLVRVCERCEAEEVSGQPRFHLHHILPRSKGGLDIPSNLMVVCPPCHKTQHASKRNQELHLDYIRDAYNKAHPRARQDGA